MSQPLSNAGESRPTFGAFFQGSLVWRFALAFSLLLGASIWALQAKPKTGSPGSFDLLSLSFWVRPLEWNTDARKPRLSGDFYAVTTTTSPDGEGWVYFGSDDGFIIRRKLNENVWDTLPLRQAKAGNPNDTATQGQTPSENAKY
jgi:hypothetical protein